jgi:hypothetical protein
MTNDFHLFPDDPAADSAIDADTALVTAYLARELSPVQIIAVEDRLATDAQFRAHAEPIIAAWIEPVFGSGLTGEAIPVDVRTRARMQAGWQRYVGERGTAKGAEPQPAGEAAASTRRRTMRRIAAVIAVMLLPLGMFAQYVRYAASHRGAPGHGAAQSIVAPFTHPSSTAPGGAPAMINDVRPGGQVWNMIPATGQPTQPRPAHALGSVVARSSVTLGSAAQLVPLSDGRLMVADPVRRLVLLFDQMLSNPRVVLDSVWGRPNTFSSGIGNNVSPGGGGGSGRSGNSNPNAPPTLRGGFSNSPSANHLVPFRDDSALWFDNLARVFVVLDPAGNVGRAVPPPPLVSLTDWGPNPPLSWGGGLVYVVVPIGLGPRGFNERRPASTKTWPKWEPSEIWNGPDTTVVIESDSLMVVRTHFGSTRIDTVGLLGYGLVTRWELSRGERSVMGTGPRYVVDPLRFVDDVTTTSEGYVVSLRAREYRLDWLAPDGQRTSQKLSYPWRRITDDMRRAILDSVSNLTNAQIENPEQNPRGWLADSTRFGRPPVNVPPPLRTPPGIANRTLRNGAPAPLPQPVDPTGRWLTGQVFPDYFPPVPVRNALRADADGNVWIQQRLPGNPDYAEWEVVSRTAGSIDRVRIPLTRTIAGFAKGGFVYLIAYDGGVARLEKVKVK